MKKQYYNMAAHYSLFSSILGDRFFHSNIFLTFPKNYFVEFS